MLKSHGQKKKSNNGLMKNFIYHSHYLGIIYYSKNSKIEVNGPNTHDVYKFLRYNSNLNKQG